MSFRIEYVFLAMAFFFGLVANSFAQDPLVISNPYAKFESDIHAAPLSPLVEFERFIPKEAEVLFVYRPSQFAGDQAYAGFNQLFGPVPNWMPNSGEKIEWMIASGSFPTINKIISYDAQKAFENVAGDLQAGFEETVIEKTNQPALANLFNLEFCGLIQFKDPTELGELKPWLGDEQNNGGLYKQKFWLGRETLDCGGDEGCIVVQLDPQTFVIGNKQKLKMALDDKSNSNKTISVMLAQLVDADFSGQLFIGSEVQDIASELAKNFPDHGFWNTLGNMRTIQLGLNLKKGQLIDAAINFQNESDAIQFKIGTQEMIVSELAKVEKRLSEFPDKDSLEAWQTRQVLGLAKSLAVSHQSESVRFTVPRPANFDQTLTQLASRLNTFQQQQQAQFDAIAAQLTEDNVVVVRRTIHAGEVVGPNDIETESWPEGTVPVDAIRNQNAVVGKKAKKKIEQGMPIIKSSIESVTR